MLHGPSVARYLRSPWHHQIQATRETTVTMMKTTRKLHPPWTLAWGSQALRRVRPRLPEHLLL